jgi:hypothetical protein
MIKKIKYKNNNIMYLNNDISERYLLDEETPNIGLKLSFDNVTPELYTLIYILSILLIVTIIFLLLRILDFIITKSIKIHDYFTYINYDPLIN